MKKYCLAYLFFLSLSVLFFWRLVFLGEILIFGDNLLHIGPNAFYWRETILQGQIPLWNPYVFAGIPFLANPATNTLSPFNLIFLWFDNVYRAISVLTIFLISLAGFGMFGFLKQLKLTTYAAVLGGIVFGFSGSVMADVNDLNSLQAVILIPYVFWALERALNQKSISSLLIVSLVLGLQFISGHPQYAYYTWLLVGSYYFFKSPKSYLKRLIDIGIIYSFFLGLVAVVLIPFLELQSLTFRPNNPEFNSSNSLEIWDMPRFVLGHFYGSWVEGNSWGPRSPLEVGRANNHGFIGLIGLGLAFLGFKYSKLSVKWFFGAMAVLTFIFAFGYNTPIYYLTNFLPLFDKFRTPMRILSVFSFSVAVLASMGMDYVQSSSLFKSKNN